MTDPLIGRQAMTADRLEAHVPRVPRGRASQANCRRPSTHCCRSSLFQHFLRAYVNTLAISPRPLNNFSHQSFSCGSPPDPMTRCTINRNSFALTFSPLSLVWVCAATSTSNASDALIRSAPVTVPSADSAILRNVFSMSFSASLRSFVISSAFLAWSSVIVPSKAFYRPTLSCRYPMIARNLLASVAVMVGPRWLPQNGIIGDTCGMLRPSETESVRSKGDDGEVDDTNAAFCQAMPGFSLCHRPLHHRVTERFPETTSPCRSPETTGPRALAFLFQAPAGHSLGRSPSLLSRPRNSYNGTEPRSAAGCLARRVFGVISLQQAS